MKNRISVLAVVIFLFGLLTSGVAAPATPKVLMIADAVIPSTVNMDNPLLTQKANQQAIYNCHGFLVEHKVATGPDGSKMYKAGEFQPGLAESWEVSGDGLIWTWHLRKGVKSVYGNELTTEDIKWTTEKNFAIKSPLTVTYKKEAGFDNLEIVDRYTFITKCKIYSPDVLAAVSEGAPSTGFVDSTEARRHATPDDPWAHKWLEKHPCGFGAYNITRWVEGQEVVFEANPNHWRGAPEIQKVVWKQVASSAVRMAMLQKGEIDATFDLTGAELNALKGKSGITIWSQSPANDPIFLSLNFNSPPFDNIKVRQAVAYAIPRKDIIEGIYSGRARVMRGEWPDIMPYFTAEFWHYDTDLEKAKALLTEAGYPSGFGCELNYAMEEPQAEPICILIQSSLAKVGIKATLNKLTGAVYYEQATKRAWKDMTLCTRRSALVLTYSYVIRLFSESKGFLNYSNWRNAQVDDILRQLLKGPLGEAELSKLYKQYQKIATEELPRVPVCLPARIVPMRDNVTGYIWYADNQLRFEYLSKK